jgi:DNA excision repair protein ERCC-8
MQLARELYMRSATVGRSNLFFDKLSTHLTRDSLQFNLYPQIVSPHSTQISSLDIDNTSEGRFLLCGSQDCTISVYDLSILGSDYHLKNNLDPQEYISSSRSGGRSIDFEEQRSTWKSKNRFRPIAKSQRNSIRPDRIALSDPLFVPDGHSHSVSQVLWYPVDTGVFLSSDSAGNVLLWDTNLFTPVSCIRKSSASFLNYGSDSDVAISSSSSPCSIASMDLPKRTNSMHLLLAIGSIGAVQTRTIRLDTYASVPGAGSRMGIPMDDDRVVYLCDIRSGSMTHQLVGHGFGGISCVKWSPIHDYLLASGSRDGTIKLWDIRKSGSTACLATLDRENKTKHDVYFASLKQSKDHDGEQQDPRTYYAQCSTRMKKKRRKKLPVIAPGDYSQVECSSHVQSHAGPVSCLEFTPDGHYMVSASVHDGLKLWTMQSGTNFGALFPTRYTGPSPCNVKTPFDQMQRTIPMKIIQPGCSLMSATVWVGGRNRKLLGYKVHGEGGVPDKVLAGHFDQVTAIASQDNCARLFSGGMDGMILGYGNRNEFEVDTCNGDLL